MELHKTCHSKEVWTRVIWIIGNHCTFRQPCVTCQFSDTVYNLFAVFRISFFLRARHFISKGEPDYFDYLTWCQNMMFLKAFSARALPEHTTSGPSEASPSEEGMAPRKEHRYGTSIDFVIVLERIFVTFWDGVLCCWFSRGLRKQNLGEWRSGMRVTQVERESHAGGR